MHMCIVHVFTASMAREQRQEGEREGRGGGKYARNSIGSSKGALTVPKCAQCGLHS